MFCPKCGKADQQPETYCRQCGDFLPDFSKQIIKSTTPEEHIKANTVLNFMTGIVSLTLAILLYAFFLGREDTHLIIYITAGFLTAMFAWQVQTFWRTLLLKKHFKRRQTENSAAAVEAPNPTASFEAAPTKELLNEADFSSVVPATVTEHTTKQLAEKINRKSS
ncbi:MAG: hypothetical protein LH472_07645 [Pyrinomonadaceae bacterium]|nr:hypothetical protein [Pyrinomonadaceae bacterium]